MVLKELENLPVTLVNENFCVSVFDQYGSYTHVNEKFCQLSGYQSSEIIGNHYSFLNPSIDLTMFMKQLAETFQYHTYWKSVVKRIHRNGRPYWVLSIISPIRSSDGTINRYLCIDSDVTETILTTKKYEESVDNLRNIQNALDFSSVVVITDNRGVITYVNDKFCQLSGYEAHELIGKTHRLVNSGHHPKSFFKEMWETIKKGDIWQGDIKNKAKDGSYYWVATTIVPFLNKKGEPFQYVAIRHDITALIEAEQSLEVALKNDFRNTVKHLHNAIFKYEVLPTGEIIFTLMEGRIARQFNLTVERINQHQCDFIKNPTTIKQITNYLRQALSGQAVQFELPIQTYTFLVYLSPIFRDKGVVEVVGTAIDITERIKAEKVIEQMAYYDYLTGLPNRRLFQNKVELAIQEGKEAGRPFALLFLDLDRFKNINDSMGHQVGDQLLQAVSERLSLCVRKDDVVARLSGDEFVLLIQSANSLKVKKIAHRIVEELSQPFDLMKYVVYVTPSIGISFFPQDGEDYNTLLRNADSAMYVAKESGRGNFQFFTKKLHEEMVEKTLIEMELRHALQKNQLSIAYQPQVNMKTNEIVGVEALLRWHHPERGMISPLYFIPIAEENGLILPIGHWVLKTACQQMRTLQLNGYPPLRLSVNVSIRQFKQPTFIAEVKQVLEETGLEPSLLNLEITESIMSNVHNCQLVLRQLRHLGVQVSIDDFGTGYSSLIYLSKFPLTHLKIDQAFIREMNTSTTMIVKAIIDLAKNLELDVLAEGVETEEQAETLRKMKCDEAQGYLYEKPLSLDQLENLLQQKK